jgi:enoyl-[acyl-carrier-protein] reductase (NADH)
MQPGTLLAGKRGLVMGVANDKSIAWGIAEAAAKQGAEIAFFLSNGRVWQKAGTLGRINWVKHHDRM